MKFLVTLASDTAVKCIKDNELQQVEFRKGAQFEVNTHGVNEFKTTSEFFGDMYIQKKDCESVKNITDLPINIHTVYEQKRS